MAKSLLQSDWTRYRQLCMIIFLISTYIPCIFIIINFFSPADAQLDSLKNNFKFALQLTLKRSYMFRCETPSSGNSIPSEPW
jgi:hypothetical protein